MLRRAGLVGMPNDTRIEQSRSLERIFVEKISADQTALRLVQLCMWFERVLHLDGARLKNLEQIPVTTLEIIEHVCQLSGGRFRIEPKNSVDDMIGPDLIRWVEVAGFSRRFEGPDDDPGRIRAQIQALAIQEFGLGQRCSLGAIVVDSRRCRLITILAQA